MNNQNCAPNCALCTRDEIEDKTDTSEMTYKVIITVVREDEAEIERDFIYHKDKDYNKEVASIINTLEAEY